MEAEMVWFSVFNQKKCKYYYLGVEAGQRNILCRSFIFLPHDKTSEGKLYVYVYSIGVLCCKTSDQFLRI